MARPREFDLDELLETALEVFWEKGYDGTSMADLLDATGLHKGSLYKVFSDKRAIYLAVLDRYTAQILDGWRKTVAASRSPRDALRRWFLGFAIYDGAYKGCFAANTSVELAPHDAEIARKLDRFTAKFRSNFVETIEDGKRAGEIASHVDSKATAEMFVLLMFGFRVVGKHSRHSAAVVDVALSALGPAVSPR
jgi:TetR/AcrR family transcriptional regulator, transcriptional repressor for nem operon